MKTSVTVKQVSSNLFTIKDKTKTTTYFYEVIADTPDEALKLYEQSSHKVTHIGTLHYDINF